MDYHPKDSGGEIRSGAFVTSDWYPGPSDFQINATGEIRLCDSEGCYNPREEMDGLSWCVLFLALCVATLGGVAIADRRRR